jgi:hypothetical protein
MPEFHEIFRFDVDLINMDGSLAAESAMVSKIIERSSSIELGFIINVVDASKFLQAITLPDRFKRISVKHTTSNDDDNIIINYTIDSLKDWYIKLDANETSLLFLHVIWNAQPSIVIKQDLKEVLSGSKA